MRNYTLSILFSVLTLGVCLAQDSLFYTFEDNGYSTNGVTDLYPSGNDVLAANVLGPLGTNTDGPVRVLDNNSGVIVSAASFDGTDDRMFLPVGTLTFNSRNMTVMAWAKIDRDQAGIQRIFTATPNGAIFFRMTATGALQGGSNVDIGGSNVLELTATAANVILDDTWMHLAMTLDDSVKLYVNGVRSGTGRATAGFDFDGSAGAGIGLEIGSAGETPKGLINDIRIFNRVLPDAQIAVAALPSFITPASNSNQYLNTGYSVYPNPSNGEDVSLDFPSNLNVKTVELLDYSGYSVYSTSNVSNLNTTDLPAGLYFVKATTFDNQVLAIQKLLITK